MISPFPISALLTDTFSLERRAETAVLDSKKKFLYYTQTWGCCATIYGRTRSIIGALPKYKTNPANTDIFYCEYREDIQEGDRFTDADSRSLYVNSIKAPGRHHLEVQCFEMPDVLTYETYSADTDAIGGEKAPTFTTYLTEIIAKIDVISEQEVVEADRLEQTIQYAITIHATSLLDFTGRLSFVQAGSTQYLRIKTVKQPDINSPWMVIGAEDL